MEQKGNKKRKFCMAHCMFHVSLQRTTLDIIIVKTCANIKQQSRSHFVHFCYLIPLSCPTSVVSKLIKDGSTYQLFFFFPKVMGMSLTVLLKRYFSEVVG